MRQQIGGVTLIHGDCLEVMPGLAAGSVDMVFADLPYGVTKNAYDVLIPFQPMWVGLRTLCTANAAMLFSAIHKFGVALCSSNLPAYRYDLVWHKSRPTGFLHANKCPLRAHEQLHVFYTRQPTYNPQFTDAGKPVNRQGKKRTSETKAGCYSKYKGVSQSTSNFRYPTSVQSILSVNSNGISHPAQKPVALLEWLIKTYTNLGDLVFDPVAGSGTTAIAAMRTGRRALCIEKDKTYYDAMVTRVAAEQAKMASNPAAASATH